MADLAQDFVKDTHPVYQLNQETWARNEALYRAGRAVRQHLQPFYWEGGQEDEHFKSRQEMAAYVPFPARMAETFVGYLSEVAPAPEAGLSLGSLGEVRSREALAAPYTEAELVFYSVNRRWTSMAAFFAEAQKFSVVTGHRWLGVEVPRFETATGTATAADVQAGRRPYWMSLSPLQVTNWYYDEGRLSALVLATRVRRLQRDGAYAGAKPQEQRLLYVAAGCEELGEAYAAGGFWLYDKDGNPLSADGTQSGEQLTGDLVSTEGEIPFVPLFYMADDDEFSRPGVTDLGSAAIAFMNLFSAGINDALEGGGRTQYVLGANKTSFNRAVDVKAQGGRLVPIEAVMVAEGQWVVPQIHDTASASASTAITEMLQRTQTAAALIAADELVRGPNTSGEARAIEFRDVKAPRLSIMAHHAEGAMQQLIRWTEMRFGHAPAGWAHWPKTFDIENTVEDWKAIFDIAALAGAESPTLTALGINAILKTKGQKPPADQARAIEEEIRASFDRNRQGADLLGAFGGDGAGGAGVQAA